MDEHDVPIRELFGRLNSSPKGLSKENAEKRLKEKGLNQLAQKKKKPFIIRFGKHLINFFALLLWAGATLAFVAEFLSPGEGNLYISLALTVVVLLNAIFTYFQESKAEEAMEAFKNMMPTTAIVLRDGQKEEIDAKYLVPGDIIFLEEGMKIPADARLIEQYALKVNNSALTGESEPQLRSTEKTHDNILESRNMVFSGTIVQTGSGKAVIYATGMNTQIGKVAGLTEQVELPVTPIHKEIQHFIKIISAIAITLGSFFFIIGFFFDNSFMQNLLFAIGIIVANVPEGLLPTVTLTLSIAARKMAKRNALVKNLESVETLGSTNVICTDKTGTLTMNEMRINSLYFGQGVVDKEIKDFNTKKDNDINMFMHASVLCNNSSLTKEKDSYLGDPTEGSLLLFAHKYVDIEKLNSIVKRVDELPFDSNTKRMVTVNQYKSGYFAYMKGAPEVVLEKCSKILINGKNQKLSSQKKQEILKQNENISKKGERVLAFAFKYFYKEYDNIEEDYVFVALAGMVDPPRPEVIPAIKTCRMAGIRVFMITGDHAFTAEAIARQIGLITTDEAPIINGDELKRLDKEELLQVLESKEVVFARASPDQKLRIVKTLQDMGERVAVTGDGVNDAPALKHADIGVAMGKCGTDVAKEAADMILMDDNFATIVNAIEEGRTIFENIKKFMAYILTSNMPQITPFIVFVLFGIPLPLTVLLILAIDLGTDLLPALGLATEKAESDIMKQPPRNKKERLFRPRLLFMSYGIIGTLQAIAGFFSYFFVMFTNGKTWHDLITWQNYSTDPIYMKATTAFFVSIVIVQIADVLICRQRRQSIFKVGLFSNKLVLLGIAVELVLAAIIVYTPFANTVLNTAPLSFVEFFIAVPFAIFIFFFDELRRLLLRRGNKFIENYINY